MERVIIKDYTNVLKGPENSGIVDLHVKAVQFPNGQVVLYSAWLPTKGELLKLQNGCPIILGVLGKSHPPVQLQVGARNDYKPKLILPTTPPLTDAGGRVLKSNGK